MVIVESLSEDRVVRHRNKMNLSRAEKLKQRLRTLIASLQLDLSLPANRWTLWLWYTEQVNSDSDPSKDIGFYGNAASPSELFRQVTQKYPYVLQEFAHVIIVEARSSDDFSIREFAYFEA